MIGFDLVDLILAKGSKHQNDPRFIRKIFSEEEQNIFAAQLNDSTIRWVMWAMKESVYKAIPKEIQQDFNPKKFILKHFSEKENYLEGQVEYNGLVFYCRCEMKNNMLWSIALKDPMNFNQVKFDILQLNSESIDLARQVLNEAIHLFLDSIGIGNYRLRHLDSGKPVIANSNDIRENISLSHHGHYAGFAYIPL